MISSYGFGKIVINGETYSSDVIVFPSGKVFLNWWRESGHSLSEKDLEEVFSSKPEVLVIGTGYWGRMDVPKATSDIIASKGIELHVAGTKKAWEIFNRLIQSRKAVGAFHLTC